MVKRVYVVPLKSSVVKTPAYKRAKKAVSALKSFMFKHMKADDVKVGRFLNERIWERGIKRPPSKVKVEAVKDDKGVVSVELVDLSKKALNILEEEKKEKALSEKKKKSSVKKSVDKKDEGLTDLVKKASESKVGESSSGSVSKSSSEDSSSGVVSGEDSSESSSEVSK